MKSKIIYLCLSVVLVASIFTNLILWTDNSTSSLTVKSLKSQISTIQSSIPTPIPTSIYEGAEVDYSKVNPIDKFFDSQTFDLSTVGMIRTASFYYECWQKEFNNAYKILLKIGDNDIGNTILKSKNSFINYAENEANLSAYISFSDAFGLETGEAVPFHEINYGSAFGFGHSDTKGKIYKSQVVRILNYFELLGVKYKFVFRESKTDSEGNEIFK